MGSVLSVDTKDDFVPVKKMQTYSFAGRRNNPPMWVRIVKHKGKSKNQLRITLDADTIKKLRWYPKDRVSIGVSVTTRRAILRRSNDEGDYSLNATATGKKAKPFSTCSISVTVRDEPTRALMPKNGNEMYAPPTVIMEEENAVLFDLA